MSNKPGANYIIVRNDIDGERVGGKFMHLGDAMQHAKDAAKLAPNTSVDVYERKATISSRIIVEDDLPKTAPRTMPA